jgi:acyl carrier protein
MEYSVAVRSFVVKNFLFGDGNSLGEDTSFMDSGIIDSTGILELVTHIEEAYGITVEDDEIVPDNLGSIANIASYLKRKCNGN